MSSRRSQLPIRGAKSRRGEMAEMEPLSTAPSSPLLGKSPGALSPQRSRRNRKKGPLLNTLSEEQVGSFLQQTQSEGDKPTILGGLLGKQTWSRYFVETRLSKCKWYNPNAGNPGAPELSKGWVYFEQFTLPRRFVDNTGGRLARAPPGDAKTELYSVWRTPIESLSDWGIGMGMYFSSISAVIILFIVAGCVNIINMMYYASDEYDPSGKFDFSLNYLLRFSAVCKDREWVVCSEGCSSGSGYEVWNNRFTNMYYGTATDANTGKDVILINRTTCDPAQFNQGIINYATVMLLILCISLYMWYLSKKEVRFEEDDTSPADYTVMVRNPPRDAVDPDQWRDFFEKFADKQVTLCTVALDNGQLLEKLVQRRKDIRALKRRFPLGVTCDFDNEDDVHAALETAKEHREKEEEDSGCLSRLAGCICKPFLRIFGCCLEDDVIWNRIKTTTEEIKKLQQKEYQPTAVFVTFETEQGQRTALEALNASETEIMSNTPMNLDPSNLFNDNVLRVVEATAPNAVRWADLQTHWISIYLRLLLTFLITFGLIGLSGVALFLARTGVNVTLFSVILTSFNSGIPIIMRTLVSSEKHYDEGGMQASLYVKITLFRWVNTVVLTERITPFINTLGTRSTDLINTINSLMISEMVLSPLLRYLDVMTILNRHYFAPRAKTEEELFSCFKGGWYNLSERFTDFTKVLLLCIYYSAHYPLSYFMGALSLIGQFWMDKFLLLRSWQKAPDAGTKMSRFSRQYFNTAAILLGAMSSGYFYFTAPFTMLCGCEDNNKECNMPDSLEFSNVRLNNGTSIGTVEAGSEGFFFCNQDINIERFPPSPENVQGADKWMTEGQENLTQIYGLTCFILVILYGVLVLGNQIIRFALSFVKGVYKPSGADQQKDFSSEIGLESFGYVPQIEVPGFNFPLLACNLDDIDLGLIGWKPNSKRFPPQDSRNYDEHNMIFDVPHESIHRSRTSKGDEHGTPLAQVGRPIFSVVKHYPPEWAR